MIRKLTTFVFGIALLTGLTLTAFGQKNDQKKPPPKGDPPVVTPQPKHPHPRETPKKPDKRNRP